jgi:SEC-C motif domain protein
MRSRYTAYTLQNERYLLGTWYGSTRPGSRLFGENEAIKWLSLDVLGHHEEGNDGVVEFVARYKVQGRAHKLHEISRFVQEGGRWFYVDGNFPPTRK